MFIIIGLVVVFAMVFGGYILSGGKFEIILYALPFEGMMIGGAAIGSFIIANNMKTIKASGRDIKKSFGKSKWQRQDYIDLLCLLFLLLKLARTKGLIALEAHIENPEESSIFKNYPKILHDHFAVDFICDTLRMMTMSLEDPHQVEAAMEHQLEKHHHEALAGAHAVQVVADGLPAIGIVAAVLGVIKTMSSIDAEVSILGGMIGGALVGTFLGVFLAYTMVGPIASRITQMKEEDHHFYLIIRDVLVAHLHGNAPQVSIELGRGNIPSDMQPRFTEVETTLSELKLEG